MFACVNIVCIFIVRREFFHKLTLAAGILDMPFLLSVNYFFYLYKMNTKSKKGKNKKISREQIMQSALASFRIEGINIPNEMALLTLKKVELSLGR
jgi:hypothetical protein